MSKATALLNVAAYSNNQADQVSASNFYDEFINELGRTPWLTNFSIIAVTAGNNNILLPSTSVDLLGVVYGNLWLTEIPNLREAETLLQDWRDMNGGPLAYVLDQVTELDLVLVPTPQVSGAAVSQVYGATYPDGNIVALYTEYRANVPAWFELVTVFATLEREYQRSSDHADTDAVTAAKGLKDILQMCVA